MNALKARWHVLVSVVTILLIVGFGTASAQNTLCYMEQGGAKFLCKSGGEIEIQSGATLDVAGTLNSSGGTFAIADDASISGSLSQTQVNAAGGSANPYDYTGTLGIMDNSDDFTLFDINITNANHTGSGNTVQAIDIAAITGDAQATETAIVIGTGWDSALDVNGTQIVLGADGGVLLDESTDDELDLTFGAGTGDLNILTGNLAVGNGSPDVTLDGEDLYVNGTLEVDGATRLDGTLALNGATTATADVTVSPDATGGNLGAKNEISGLPRIKMVTLGTMVNGTSEVVNYVDDSPDGEWTAIDADVTVSADATIYRTGAKSLKLAFAATAADDDGATTDITNDDLEANESIGFWIRSDTILDAGDLDILIDDTDAAPDQSYNVCAVATANVWTWCEVDISALAAGTGNVVDKVGFVLKDAAGLGAFNVYIDLMYKWDADDEEALGTAILQDGVLSVMTLATANTETHTAAAPVEGTDFIVHYETGSDFIVTLTDQSANSGIALIAY